MTEKRGHTFLLRYTNILTVKRVSLVSRITKNKKIPAFDFKTGKEKGDEEE
jgi:hypothetical protein